MGLLSDPEYGSVKWVKVLKKVHRPVCWLCYLGAIVWFVMLGNRDFNNETYFSENALLPGLVTNEFNAEAAANKFFAEFQQELLDKYDDTDEMPVSWLVAKMSQLHLQVFTHNFTLRYPLGVVEQTFHGTNVYGILRAARTPSQEALVVAAPYRALHSHQKGTAAGIALMLAFAQFARPQKYWAKDIIFLVTQYEQLGMQAWLEAYHGQQSDKETFYTSLGSFWKPGSWNLGEINGLSWSNHQKCLDPGKLKGRSGSIQAAINLEFHTPKIKYVEVKVEGLNGQLPNLDLVNLVHKLCVKAGIHHSYKNSYSWVRGGGARSAWGAALRSVVGQVWAQAGGAPSGNHGLFLRYAVPAVTLEGRGGGDPAGDPPRVNSLGNCNFHRLGLCLESVLRSLNNLLERFHQSYFFYLLAATNRFISIGQYMPSLCLMCVAMLIRALYIWVSIQQDEDTTNKPTDKKTDETTEDKKEITNEKLDESVENNDKTLKKDKESDKKVQGDDKSETVLRKRNIKKDLPEQKEHENISQKKEEKSHLETKVSEVSTGAACAGGSSAVHTGAWCVAAHLLGYGVTNSPVVFCAIGARLDILNEQAVLYGLCAWSAALCAGGAGAARRLRGARAAARLQLAALVELAAALLAVGLHNFALGLTLAALYTPLALLVDVARPGTTRLARGARLALCALAQPLLALWLGMAAYSARLFPEDAPLATLSRATDALAQALMFAIVDSLIYGNWVFNVVATVFLPIWVMFWQLANCTVSD